MGCGQSKLGNEETVRRCKERRLLMKEAVYARHHLAAAHSNYCRSLRLTGAALVRFATGEPLSVSDHTPAVLLHSPPSTSAANIPNPPAPPQSATSSHHQPPPPIRRKRPIKLPHILSDSSLTSSPPPNLNFGHDAKANYSYSNTPSQVSSVWDWDNLYAPPSPPNSEFFEQRHSNKSTSAPANIHKSDNDHYTDKDNDDKSSYSKLQNQDDQFRNPFSSDQASNYSSYSKLENQDGQFRNPFSSDQASNYSSYSKYSDTKNPTRQHSSMAQKKGQGLNRWESEEEEETEREEVQCSDWGDHDHYSTTSSSSTEDEPGDHMARSDFQTRSHAGSMTDEATKASANSGSTNVNANSKFSSKSDKPNLETDDKSSASWGNGNQGRVNSDMRIMVRHKDLTEIVAAINEYFVKAASSGEQVSEILEIGRAQLNRSFKQLKKRVYHSSGILSKLSSSWTSRPPLGVKYQFEPSSFEQSGGTKSLCSTLERLLAWEKKLYQEVKAREGVKIDHEKKLSLLQSQEYRGGHNSKLDKTKVSINKLQSLMVVTSQAVSTTSSAIVVLRDSNLVPQIIELCHGFMYMWRSMHQFHEIQNDIVQQVRGLVIDTNKGGTTSALHKQTTRDLESAVSAWHSSFCSLIKYQRDFVRSLHGWFKLTLLPVQSEPSNGTRDMPEVFAFCDEWKHALDRVPDTVASEAIKSFINIIHSIALKQAEELKIKKRTETASKELEKKSSSLRHIERKFYQSYSTVGLGGIPDTGPDNSHVLDARDPLAEKKAELATCQRLVEDEMLRHSKAVELTRALTLNNIQTGLPGVFQAMTSFSAVMTESLEIACARSYAI